MPECAFCFRPIPGVAVVDPREDWLGPDRGLFCTEEHMLDQRTVVTLAIHSELIA